MMKLMKAFRWLNLARETGYTLLKLKQCILHAAPEVVYIFFFRSYAACCPSSLSLRERVGVRG
jgi:hypothetical protein